MKFEDTITYVELDEQGRTIKLKGSCTAADLKPKNKTKE